jgi:hypothetical protein
MISPRCDKCGENLTAFGALAFSPPDERDMVRKYHLCVECFARLEEWLAVKPVAQGDGGSER